MSSHRLLQVGDVQAKEEASQPDSCPMEIDPLELLVSKLHDSHVFSASREQA